MPRIKSIQNVVMAMRAMKAISADNPKDLIQKIKEYEKNTMEDVFAAMVSIKDITKANPDEEDICRTAINAILSIYTDNKGIDGVNSADATFIILSLCPNREPGSGIDNDAAMQILDMINADKDNALNVISKTLSFGMIFEDDDLKNKCVELLKSLKDREDIKDWEKNLKEAIEMLGGIYEEEKVEEKSIAEKIEEEKKTALNANGEDAGKCMDTIVKYACDKDASAEDKAKNADAGVEAIAAICKDNPEVDPVHAIGNINSIVSKKDADAVKAVEKVKEICENNKEKVTPMVAIHFLTLMAKSNNACKDAVIEQLKKIAKEHKEAKGIANVSITDLGGEIDKDDVKLSTSQEKIDKVLEGCKAKENPTDPQRALQEIVGIITTVADNEDKKEVASSALKAISTICKSHKGDGKMGAFCAHAIGNRITEAASDCINTIKELHTAKKGKEDSIGYQDIIDIIKELGKQEGAAETAISALKEIMKDFPDKQVEFKVAVIALGGKFEEKKEEKAKPVDEITGQKDKYESYDPDNKKKGMDIAFQKIIDIVNANKSDKEVCDTAAKTIIEIAEKANFDNSVSALGTIVSICALESTNKAKAIDNIVKYYEVKKDSVSAELYVSTLYEIASKGKDEVKKQVADILKKYVNAHKEDQKGVAIAMDLAKKLGAKFDEEEVKTFTPAQKITKILEYHEAKKADPYKVIKMEKAVDNFRPVSTSCTDAYNKIFAIANTEEADKETIAKGVECMKKIATDNKVVIGCFTLFDDLIRLALGTKKENHEVIIPELKEIVNGDTQDITPLNFISALMMMGNKSEDLKPVAVEILKDLKDNKWKDHKDIIKDALFALGEKVQEENQEEKPFAQRINELKENCKYSSSESVKETEASIVLILNADSSTKETCEAAVDAFKEIAEKADSSEYTRDILEDLAAIYLLPKVDKKKVLEIVTTLCEKNYGIITSLRHASTLYDIGCESDDDMKKVVLDKLKAIYEKEKDDDEIVAKYVGEDIKRLERELGIEHDSAIEKPLTPAERIDKVLEYHNGVIDKAKVEAKKEGEWSSASKNSLEAMQKVIETAQANKDDEAITNKAVEAIGAIAEKNDSKITVDTVISNYMALAMAMPDGKETKATDAIKKTITDNKGSDESKMKHISVIHTLMQAGTKKESLKTFAIDMLKEIKEYGWDAEKKQIIEALGKLGYEEKVVEPEKMTPAQQIEKFKQDCDTRDDNNVFNSVVSVIDIVENNSDDKEICGTACNAIKEIAEKAAPRNLEGIIIRLGDLREAKNTDFNVLLDTIKDIYSKNEKQVDPRTYTFVTFTVGSSCQKQEDKDKAIANLKELYERVKDDSVNSKYVEECIKELGGTLDRAEVQSIAPVDRIAKVLEYHNGKIDKDLKEEVKEGEWSSATKNSSEALENIVATAKASITDQTVVDKAIEAIGAIGEKNDSNITADTVISNYMALAMAVPAGNESKATEAIKKTISDNKDGDESKMKHISVIHTLMQAGTKKESLKTFAIDMLKEINGYGWDAEKSQIKEALGKLGYEEKVVEPEKMTPAQQIDKIKQECDTRDDDNVFNSVVSVIDIVENNSDDKEICGTACNAIKEIAEKAAPRNLEGIIIRLGDLRVAKYTDFNVLLDTIKDVYSKDEKQAYTRTYAFVTFTVGSSCQKQEDKDKAIANLKELYERVKDDSVNSKYVEGIIKELGGTLDLAEVQSIAPVDRIAKVLEYHNGKIDKDLKEEVKEGEWSSATKTSSEALENIVATAKASITDQTVVDKAIEAIGAIGEKNDSNITADTVISNYMALAMAVPAGNESKATEAIKKTISDNKDSDESKMKHISVIHTLMQAGSKNESLKTFAIEMLKEINGYGWEAEKAQIKEALGKLGYEEKELEPEKMTPAQQIEKIKQDCDNADERKVIECVNGITGIVLANKDDKELFVTACNAFQEIAKKAEPEAIRSMVLQIYMICWAENANNSVLLDTIKSIDAKVDKKKQPLAFLVATLTIGSNCKDKEVKDKAIAYLKELYERVKDNPVDSKYVEGIIKELGGTLDLAEVQSIAPVDRIAKVLEYHNGKIDKDLKEEVKEGEWSSATKNSSEALENIVATAKASITDNTVVDKAIEAIGAIGEKNDSNITVDTIISNYMALAMAVPAGNESKATDAIKKTITDNKDGESKINHISVISTLMQAGTKKESLKTFAIEMLKEINGYGWNAEKPQIKEALSKLGYDIKELEPEKMTPAQQIEKFKQDCDNADERKVIECVNGITGIVCANKNDKELFVTACNAFQEIAKNAEPEAIRSMVLQVYMICWAENANNSVLLDTIKSIDAKIDKKKQPLAFLVATLTIGSNCKDKEVKDKAIAYLKELYERVKDNPVDSKYVEETIKKLGGTLTPGEMQSIAPADRIAKVLEYHNGIIDNDRKEEIKDGYWSSATINSAQALNKIVATAKGNITDDNVVDKAIEAIGAIGAKNDYTISVYTVISEYIGLALAMPVGKESKATDAIKKTISDNKDCDEYEMDHLSVINSLMRAGIEKESLKPFAIEMFKEINGYGWKAEKEFIKEALRKLGYEEKVEKPENMTPVQKIERIKKACDTANIPNVIDSVNGITDIVLANPEEKELCGTACNAIKEIAEKADPEVLEYIILRLGDLRVAKYTDFNVLLDTIKDVYSKDEKLANPRTYTFVTFSVGSSCQKQEDKEKAIANLKELYGKNSIESLYIGECIIKLGGTITPGEVQSIAPVDRIAKVLEYHNGKIDKDLKEEVKEGEWSSATKNSSEALENIVATAKGSITDQTVVDKAIEAIGAIGEKNDNNITVNTVISNYMALAMATPTGNESKATEAIKKTIADNKDGESKINHISVISTLMQAGTKKESLKTFAIDTLKEINGYGWDAEKAQIKEALGKLGYEEKELDPEKMTPAQRIENIKKECDTADNSKAAESVNGIVGIVLANTEEKDLCSTACNAIKEIAENAAPEILNFIILQLRMLSVAKNTDFNVLLDTIKGIYSKNEKLMDPQTYTYVTFNVGSSCKKQEDKEKAIANLKELYGKVKEDTIVSQYAEKCIKKLGGTLDLAELQNIKPVDRIAKVLEYHNGIIDKDKKEEVKEGEWSSATKNSSEALENIVATAKASITDQTVVDKAIEAIGAIGEKNDSNITVDTIISNYMALAMAVPAGNESKATEAIKKTISDNKDSDESKMKHISVISTLMQAGTKKESIKTFAIDMLKEIYGYGWDAEKSQIKEALSRLGYDIKELEPEKMTPAQQIEKYKQDCDNADERKVIECVNGITGIVCANRDDKELFVTACNAFQEIAKKAEPEAIRSMVLQVYRIYWAENADHSVLLDTIKSIDAKVDKKKDPLVFLVATLTIGSNCKDKEVKDKAIAYLKELYERVKDDSVNSKYVEGIIKKLGGTLDLAEVQSIKPVDRIAKVLEYHNGKIDKDLKEEVKEGEWSSATKNSSEALDNIVATAKASITDQTVVDKAIEAIGAIGEKNDSNITADTIISNYMALAMAVPAGNESKATDAIKKTITDNKDGESKINHISVISTLMQAGTKKESLKTFAIDMLKEINGYGWDAEKSQIKEALGKLGYEEKELEPEKMTPAQQIDKIKQDCDTRDDDNVFNSVMSVIDIVENNSDDKEICGTACNAIKEIAEKAAPRNLEGIIIQLGELREAKNTDFNALLDTIKGLYSKNEEQVDARTYTNITFEVGSSCKNKEGKDKAIANLKELYGNIKGDPVGALYAEECIKKLGGTLDRAEVQSIKPVDRIAKVLEYHNGKIDKDLKEEVKEGEWSSATKNSSEALENIVKTAKGSITDQTVVDKAIEAIGAISEKNDKNITVDTIISNYIALAMAVPAGNESKATEAIKKAITDNKDSDESKMKHISVIHTLMQAGSKNESLKTFAIDMLKEINGYGWNAEKPQIKEALGKLGYEEKVEDQKMTPAQQIDNLKQDCDTADDDATIDCMKAIVGIVLKNMGEEGLCGTACKAIGELADKASVNISKRIILQLRRLGHEKNTENGVLLDFIKDFYSKREQNIAPQMFANTTFRVASMCQKQEDKEKAIANLKELYGKVKDDIIDSKYAEECIIKLGGTLDRAEMQSIKPVDRIAKVLEYHNGKIDKDLKEEVKEGEWSSATKNSSEALENIVATAKASITDQDVVDKAIEAIGAIGEKNDNIITVNTVISNYMALAMAVPEGNESKATEAIKKTISDNKDGNKSKMEHVSVISTLMQAGIKKESIKTFAIDMLKDINGYGWNAEKDLIKGALTMLGYEEKVEEPEKMTPAQKVDKIKQECDTADNTNVADSVSGIADIVLANTKEKELCGTACNAIKEIAEKAAPENLNFIILQLRRLREAKNADFNVLLDTIKDLYSKNAEKVDPQTYTFVTFNVGSSCKNKEDKDKAIANLKELYGKVKENPIESMYVEECIRRLGEALNPAEVQSIKPADRIAKVLEYHNGKIDRDMKEEVKEGEWSSATKSSSEALENIIKTAEASITDQTVVGKAIEAIGAIGEKNDNTITVDTIINSYVDLAMAMPDGEESNATDAIKKAISDNKDDESRMKHVSVICTLMQMGINKESLKNFAIDTLKEIKGYEWNAETNLIRIALTKLGVDDKEPDPELATPIERINWLKEHCDEKAEEDASEAESMRRAIENIATIAAENNFDEKASEEVMEAARNAFVDMGNKQCCLNVLDVLFKNMSIIATFTAADKIKMLTSMSEIYKQKKDSIQAAHKTIYLDSVFNVGNKSDDDEVKEKASDILTDYQKDLTDDERPEKNRISEMTTILGYIDDDTLWEGMTPVEAINSLVNDAKNAKGKNNENIVFGDSYNLITKIAHNHKNKDKVSEAAMNAFIDLSKETEIISKESVLSFLTNIVTGTSINVVDAIAKIDKYYDDNKDNIHVLDIAHCMLNICQKRRDGNEDAVNLLNKVKTKTELEEQQLCEAIIILGGTRKKPNANPIEQITYIKENCKSEDPEIVMASIEEIMNITHIFEDDEEVGNHAVKTIASYDQEKIKAIPDKVINAIKAIGIGSAADKAESLDSIKKVFDANKDAASVITYIDALYNVADNQEKAIKDKAIEILKQVVADFPDHEENANQAIILLGGKPDNIAETLTVIQTIEKYRDECKDAEKEVILEKMTAIVKLAVENASAKDVGNAAVNALSDAFNNYADKSDKQTVDHTIHGISTVACETKADAEPALGKIADIIDGNKDSVNIATTILAIFGIGKAREDGREKAIEVLKKIRKDNPDLESRKTELPIKHLGGKLDEEEAKELTPIEQINELRTNSKDTSTDIQSSSIDAIIRIAKDNKGAQDVADAAVDGIEGIFSDNNKALSLNKVIDDIAKVVLLSATKADHALDAIKKLATDSSELTIRIHAIKKVYVVALRTQDCNEKAIEVVKAVMGDKSEIKVLGNETIVMLDGQVAREDEAGLSDMAKVRNEGKIGLKASNEEANVCMDNIVDIIAKSSLGAKELDALINKGINCLYDIAINNNDANADRAVNDIRKIAYSSVTEKNFALEIIKKIHEKKANVKVAIDSIYRVGNADEDNKSMAIDMLDDIKAKTSEKEMAQNAIEGLGGIAAKKKEEEDPKDKDKADNMEIKEEEKPEVKEEENVDDGQSMSLDDIDQDDKDNEEEEKVEEEPKEEPININDFFCDVIAVGETTKEDEEDKCSVHIYSLSTADSNYYNYYTSKGKKDEIYIWSDIFIREGEDVLKTCKEHPVACDFGIRYIQSNLLSPQKKRTDTCTDRLRQIVKELQDLKKEYLISQPIPTIKGIYDKCKSDPSFADHHMGEINKIATNERFKKEKEVQIEAIKHITKIVLEMTQYATESTGLQYILDLGLNYQRAAQDAVLNARKIITKINPSYDLYQSTIEGVGKIGLKAKESGISAVSAKDSSCAALETIQRNIADKKNYEQLDDRCDELLAKINGVEYVKKERPKAPEVSKDIEAEYAQFKNNAKPLKDVIESIANIAKDNLDDTEACLTATNYLSEFAIKEKKADGEKILKHLDAIARGNAENFPNVVVFTAAIARSNAKWNAKAVRAIHHFYDFDNGKNYKDLLVRTLEELQEQAASRSVKSEAKARLKKLNKTIAARK